MKIKNPSDAPNIVGNFAKHVQKIAKEKRDLLEITVGKEGVGMSSMGLRQAEILNDALEGMDAEPKSHGAEVQDICPERQDSAQILAAFNMLSSGVGLKETMSRCLSLSAFVFDRFEKTAPKTPRRIEVIVNSTVRITIEDVSDFKEVG